MPILCAVITLVCLVALGIEVGGFTLYYVLKKRSDRIAFIRNFKKGKCAIIYVVALPLYWIGIIYSKAANGHQVNYVNEIFTAVQKVFNLIFIQFDVPSIELLMADLPIYAIAVYLCFFLIIVNAGLFTISFIGQSIWSFAGSVKRTSGIKDHLMIFGYNESSIDIYNSDKARAKLIVGKMTPEEQERLYQENIYYASVKSYEGKVQSFMKLAENEKREHIAIINTCNDEESIAICKLFVSAIDAYTGNKDDLYKRLRIYVFGEPRYQTVYDDIVAEAHGCIRYKNKYQDIAMDFINEYPLSLFMNEGQIDYSTSLVKNDVNINVVMIGFGSTAQQIFLTSVANNQFLCRPLKMEGEAQVPDLQAEPVLKKVNYCIFDKYEARKNKNLNHSYYRYKNECLSECVIEADFDKELCLNENASKYLPLPSLPARESFEVLDVNDPKFYEKIRAAISAGKNDASFIVIAFGTDLENIDMAQKLVEKRKEWELDNVVIFVKARRFRKQDTLISDKDCYFIGYERECVYNIDKILGDDIYKMAKMRNEIYDIEYVLSNENPSLGSEGVEKIKDEADKKWYKSMSQMLRDSSLYGVLSLRSKLNLMGLDYIKMDKDASKNSDALSYDEYIKIYSGGGVDKPKLLPISVQDKGIVEYTLSFNEHSMRTYLAIHEHQRWNSFMISKGLIPSTLEQIYNEKLPNGKNTNGKRYDVRRHGNITTFKGLVGYRRLLAYRDAGKTGNDYAAIMSVPQENEQSYDVIKYDYQLLDDAHWLLTAGGYKIIYKR